MVSFEIISDGIKITTSGMLREDQEIVLDARNIDSLKKLIEVFETGETYSE